MSKSKIQSTYQSPRKCPVKDNPKTCLNDDKKIIKALKKDLQKERAEKAQLSEWISSIKAKEKILHEELIYLKVVNQNLMKKIEKISNRGRSLEHSRGKASLKSLKRNKKVYESERLSTEPTDHKIKVGGYFGRLFGR